MVIQGYCAQQTKAVITTVIKKKKHDTTAKSNPLMGSVFWTQPTNTHSFYKLLKKRRRRNEGKKNSLIPSRIILVIRILSCSVSFLLRPLLKKELPNFPSSPHFQCLNPTPSDAGNGPNKPSLGAEYSLTYPTFSSLNLSERPKLQHARTGNQNRPSRIFFFCLPLPRQLRYLHTCT